MIIGQYITEDIIRQDPRYTKKEKITTKDISVYTQEEYNLYQEEALKKVNAMHEEWGEGNNACTLVRIYNATGEALHLLANSQQDWSGHMWKYPNDIVIGNGQWSVFIHTKTSGAARGSSSCIVYQALETGSSIFLGWCVSYYGYTGIYAEVFDNLDEKFDWDKMYYKVAAAWNNSKHETVSASNMHDILVEGTIGNTFGSIADYLIKRK